MNKTSVPEEFVRGKHGIDFVSNAFTIHFKSAEIKERPMPTFQKLEKSLSDEAIESELKPGLCEIGDVFIFLDNVPEECKDGNWNLFYFPGCVVFVCWHAGHGWYVRVSLCGDGHWDGVDRVFSSATDA